MTVDPQAQAGSPVPGPTPATPSPGRRTRSTSGVSPGMVLASAVLSAALASGGTAGLLLATAPTAGPLPTAAVVTATEPPSAVTTVAVVGEDAVVAVAGAAEASVVTISDVATRRRAILGGSGVIVSADGLILTTAIAAPLDTTYAVLLSDQRETTAEVVASDPARGLVLLRTATTGLAPARLAASGSTLVVGQRVVAVGSPLGEFTDTVTSGIVSSLGRSIDMTDPSTGTRVALDELIQTDAAINAGSSGGPLLDLSGIVVGIIATSAGDGQGIGFAIPIGAAADLVARAGS